MCDYSLEARESRPARIGESVKSSTFPGTTTKGFCPVDDSGVAVCMLPGTELTFEKPVTWQGSWPILAHLFGQSRSRTAIFRKVNEGMPAIHRDALELDDGTVVLVTNLRPGQIARVLQLPVDMEAPPARNDRVPEVAGREMETLGVS